MARNATASPAPPIDPLALAGSIPVDEASHAPEPEPSVPEQPRISQEGDLPPSVSSPRPAARGRFGAATSKPVVQTGSPQSKRELDRMLPSGLKVHIYKRHDDGQLSYCKEYSATEVQGFGTIESFIRKHVVPEWEYGDYEVFRQDAQGNLNVSAKVRIEEPASHRAARANTQQKPTESLREMFEIFKEQERLAKGDTQVMRTPMDELSQNWKTMKEMGLIPEGQRFDPMMSMMMMRMFAPEPQRQDPVMTRLLEKISERIDHLETMQQSQAAFTPLPPPPPPPPNPMEQMQPLFNLFQEGQRQMAEAIRELGRSQSQRDPVKDLADLRVLLGKDEPAMTPTTMLAMLPQMRDALVPQSNQDPFQKTLENFRLFRLMQKEFSDGGGEQQESGPPEENFWSFARAALSSPAGAMIGQAIKESLSGQGMQQHQQAQVLSQRQKAENVARRRAAEAAAQAEARAAQAAHAAQARHQQAQQPPPQSPEDEDSVEIPPGFISVHAPKINAAGGASERVQAIIESFQLLGTSAEFRPVVGKVFYLCQQNRRIECLDHLREILQFFADNEILDAKLPDVGVRDFDNNWKTIRRVMKMPEIPEVFPDGYVPPKPTEKAPLSPVQGEPVVTPSPERVPRLNGSGAPNPVAQPEPTEKVAVSI